MQQYFNHLINKIIKKYKIVSILIAISGGQDSICLIQLFESFINSYKDRIKKLEYIYIDHQWRIDSKQHIEHLINYFTNIKKRVHIYQIFSNTFSENISRRNRYHIIINHAKIYRYEAILTAHTQTDKIETFILNLTRGSSIEGITSLNLHKKFNYHLNIFRPLINKNRKDINFFCKKWLLPIWLDVTNCNQNIKRNRIRNEIMPYLNKYFNYKLSYQLAKFLKTCYYDNEYIKQKTTKLYVSIKSYHYISINIFMLKKEHLSIQIRIIQLFIYHNFCFILNEKNLLKIIHYINRINHNYKSTNIKWKNINLYFSKKWLYVMLKKN